jgi:hypothetical protein
VFNIISVLLACSGITNRVAAQTRAIELQLGSENTTKITLDNLKPGTRGEWAVNLRNSGVETGTVQIWIADIVIETPDGGAMQTISLSSTDPVPNLIFDISHPLLSTNLSLPAGLDQLPQANTSDTYLRLKSLGANQATTLNLTWKYPGTVDKSGENQTITLSFNINFLLKRSVITNNIFCTFFSCFCCWYLVFIVCFGVLPLIWWLFIKKKEWTFISDHGAVLSAIANRGLTKAKNIASDIRMSERVVKKVIRDLEEAGYISTTTQDGIVFYSVNYTLMLRRNEMRDIKIKLFLDMLKPRR